MGNSMEATKILEDIFQLANDAQSLIDEAIFQLQKTHEITEVEASKIVNANFERIQFQSGNEIVNITNLCRPYSV